jgi:hypothetical protein
MILIIIDLNRKREGEGPREGDEDRNETKHMTFPFQIPEGPRCILWTISGTLHTLTVLSELKGINIILNF